jgi:hypothetical protein
VCTPERLLVRVLVGNDGKGKESEGRGMGSMIGEEEDGEDVEEYRIG